MAKRSRKRQTPIGEVIREHRVTVLNKGLRETARTLEIAPAHLTDIEKGRRNPSEPLLVKIVKVYGIEEAELRAGWSRPEVVVEEVASQDSTTAKKVPEFLRSARHLTAEQWDDLIKRARRLSKE